MLLDHCAEAAAEVRLREEVRAVRPAAGGGFDVVTSEGAYTAGKVVIASGGLSLPKIASDLAFRTANRLGLGVVAPRAALVPLTWNSEDKRRYEALSGISLDAETACNGMSFRESILFTHRGLSGPAMLQISSYWREGDTVLVNLLPGCDAAAWLLGEREKNPQQRIASLLKKRLANRLVDTLAGDWFPDTKIGSRSPRQVADLGAELNGWAFRPGGSEGYRTAASSNHTFFTFFSLT